MNTGSPVWSESSAGIISRIKAVSFTAMTLVVFYPD